MRFRLTAIWPETRTLPNIATHPDIAEAYRHNVGRLTALNAPEIEAGGARQALRNMTELITAEPGASGRGVDLFVHGRLAQILQIAENRPDLSRDGCMLSLVAKTGLTAAVP